MKDKNLVLPVFPSEFMVPIINLLMSRSFKSIDDLVAVFGGQRSGGEWELSSLLYENHMGRRSLIGTCHPSFEMGEPFPKEIRPYRNAVGFSRSYCFFEERSSEKRLHFVIEVEETVSEEEYEAAGRRIPEAPKISFEVRQKEYSEECVGCYRPLNPENRTWECGECL